MTSPQELVTYIALPLVKVQPMAYESAETVVLQRIIGGCRSSQQL